MRQISLTRYLCASFLALRMSWGVTLGGVVWGSVTGVPMSKNNCPKPPPASTIKPFALVCQLKPPKIG